jgi:hypothetical protein
MQTKTYEEQLFVIKQELDLLNEEASVVSQDKQKCIGLQKCDIAAKIDNKEYLGDIKNLILDDTKERNEELMEKIKMVIPQILYQNSHFSYIYLITFFLILLLVLSLAKQYIL